MAITCGFFDSVNGDRTYDAEQMSSYFDGLISNGVYENIGERFAVTSANNGMNINVGSGRAIIQSHWVQNDATVVLTLDPSDVQLRRIDAVVLRLDLTNREIVLTIKKGTAASSAPPIPPITQTETIYEIYLALVYVAKGATQPTSITDLRPSSYCGWVTGLIEQVDTSDLFTQWQAAYENQFAAFDAYIQAKQAAFDSWFSALTKTLNVNTAITKYQNVVTVTRDTFYAIIGIEEFESDSDVLFVYLNGVFLAEGQDYELDSSGTAIQSATRTFKAGSELTFVVLKNVIGKDVATAGAGQLTAVLGGTPPSPAGYATEAGFVYKGTAASSAQFTIPLVGRFRLMVIALNSEASTFELNLAVQVNGSAVETEAVAYNEYSGSGTNSRNYRIISYSADFSAGDTVQIDLTERSGYTSFVYALLDETYPFGNLVQTVSTADATASGSYSADAIALYGTFDGSAGGTVQIADAAADTTVTTDNPGTNYKSAYIFWFEKEES